MQRHSRSCSLIIAALLLILLAEPVVAWEEDLHYGLTKWVALQAGLAERAAESIAEGNLRTDAGILDARRLVFWYACFSRDPNGSRLVRDHHFPTFEDLPSPPRKRAVEVGGRAAMRPSQLELEVRPVGDHERRFALLKLGTALHVLQDSWSHYGEPEIPPLCDSGLAWAHPKARGGWDSHDADLTPKYTKDAQAAAQRTYEVLVAYAKANPWAVKQPARDWAALAPDVNRFAQASTKAAKGVWFKERGFTDLGFLDRITLPDGDGSPVPAVQFSTQSASVNPEVIGPVPPDAVKFISEFWTMWVSSTDFSRLVDTYLAPDRVAASLGLKGVDARMVSRAALGMWRVRDHGRVAALAHEMPRFSKKFSDLDKLVQNRAMLVPTEGLAYGMLGLGKGRSPIAIAPAGDGRYVGFGRFRHAPHDVVRATTAQVDGQWRVVEIGWVVEH